jgi:2-isopropylmalate synthase
LSPKQIMIYDTTLRDGTQAEGISFSARDKVILAKKMDQFGIDYIEGGWPGSNPRDMEFFQLIQDETFEHAKIAAFGSTRRANASAEEDSQLQMLLDANTPVVTIFGKTWLLHVTEVLKTTPKTNLEMIEDSVAYLTKMGKEVIYDAEHFFDGYKNDSEYALATLKAAINGGASFVTLCDTNGGTQVAELGKIVLEINNLLPDTNVGVHCHNDCGLGVAVSIAGIESGANMVQGTFNGYGERVGNANLTSIIPNLALKLNYDLKCAKKLDQLKVLSNTVDELANRVPSRRSPFVGKSAFAHKGGVHANAAKKVAHSYEHMKPELIGNEQRILLSDMSGGSSISMKAKKMGVDINEKSPLMKSFLERIKQLENEGHEFENADASFYVILHEHFKGHEDIFELVSYRIISEVVRGTDHKLSEAVVKLKLAGEEEVKISVAESSGPVGSLDHAARIAFGAHFPELKKVHLIDYKVRILQSNLGTDSITQVLIKSSDGQDSWWTSGADSSIIEASWEALRDSYRYKLLKTSRGKTTL